MSTEVEFSKWLRRKEKTFEESLKFAIKSWQSLEFTLQNKYEIILKWLSEQKDLKEETIVETDFKDLLKLRAQPGLINQEVKEAFIEWCLQTASTYDHRTRKWCELLALLVDFELLQDLYRINYELQARVYAAIFSSYEKYLEHLIVDDKHFRNTYEAEFFASVLNNVKETVKRCGNVQLYEAAFTSVTLKALINVLLTMRTFKVNFFAEISEIERLLCMEMTEKELVTRIMKMPLHVRLIVLECSIVNRRGIDTFMLLLLQNTFRDFVIKVFSPQDRSVHITMAAYVLEMLGRHDVSLNMKMVGKKDKTALEFLGDNIYKAVTGVKGSYVKEILMVLCAALRLNPLILEKNVFDITVRMILAPKSGDKEEQQLFEEYLVLLMDVFRRLSRAEKFVSNLLKTLNENLEKTNAFSNTKRKPNDHLEETPSKKAKNAEQKNVENIVAPKYLNILFQDFFKPVLTKLKSSENSFLSASGSFSKLQNYWPSSPAGVAFSKIITGLVSKPSLVIWKTLLFAFKDFMDTFKTKKMLLNERDLFQLDFHVALLTQYFAGCKLAEHSEKFLGDLETQRKFTMEVLQLFGKFILEREHHPRTMAAFLEISYSASCFELMLIFYRPDGCNHETLQPNNALERLHSFLSVEEWTLIQQRVLNFGQSTCKYLLQRLLLQKSQSTMLLLGSQQEKLQLETSFNTADKENMYSLLKAPNAKWLVSQLSRRGKVSIAACITKNKDLLPLVFDDLDLLEYVSLSIYEELCSSLSSKHSLLKSLSCDFDEIRQCVEISAIETLIKRLIDVINTRSENVYELKKLDIHQIKINLDLLSQLPVGHLRRQRKTLIFALQLSLYRDLKSAHEDDLAAQALEIMKDILHFGQQVLIFKYFPARCLIQLLPPDTCWELYEFLFSTIKSEEKGTYNFLQDLAVIIQESQKDEQRKLLLIAIETLSSLTGPCAKRMRKYLDEFLKIFSKHLESHFKETNDGTSKKDKKFVQKTLAGFAPYTSALLTKSAKAKDSKAKETNSDIQLEEEITEDFRRISKIYIGHSMDYRNPHAIRLMQLALNHRELLHLDQDEIEFVLTHYWNQINEDLKDEHQNTKTMESAIQMIIGNKTNEDLLLTLKSLATNDETKNIYNILRLLNLISKCPFSIIKGAIFNEQYKQITVNITLRLVRDDQQQFNDHDLIIELLHCHQAVLDNKMVPISTDTMDSILSFLMDINIKKFPLCDTNLKVFHSLHLAMTDVCSSLIKQRHILLMDRVPQYMHIFKDLIQSIVWYKSDRQKDTALPSDELDDLAELSMKLEALMHIIAQHSVGFKRVAPFVLTFIINLMVANKRPTTLYNKIKTHIESICYDLVGICDHRVGRFILRCSNEAGRQLYELLVKDYQKYHKFKGKV